MTTARGVLGAVLLVLLLALLGPLRPLPAAAASAADAYLAGYASAVLEREFGVHRGAVQVRDGVVIIDGDALVGVDADQVRAALEAIDGIHGVEIAAVPARGATPGPAGAAVNAVTYETGAFPGGELFKSLRADPRWPHFGASYRRYIDHSEFGDVAAVSFGETFSFYRWRHGEHWWETGLQAGVFAIFDLDARSSDLINADYFVAGFAGYRHRDLSALLRLFHQSSHLGDEFLLRTRVKRVNLSYESVDLKLSYDLWPVAGQSPDFRVLRLYAGGGVLFDQDPASLAPWSTQVGLEFQSPWPGPEWKFRPIAAVDIQNREENDWSPDLSARVGVQFDGVLLARNLQILLEYFHGHSPDGQFFREDINYIGLGAHFHF